MKNKPDRQNARELRIAKLRHVPPARLFAEMFLHLACRYRHPRERDLLAEYMMAADGLDLAHLVRWPGTFDNLDRLEQRLDEHAKANPVGEGDGEGRW